jgi:hypothetical protein
LRLVSCGGRTGSGSCAKSLLPARNHRHMR